MYGVDYTVNDALLVLAPGENSVCTSLLIIDDILFRSPEEYVIAVELVQVDLLKDTVIINDRHNFTVDDSAGKL